MIPIKYRSLLASGAVVTRNLDQSLALYPQAAWEEIAAELAALPLTAREARGFARLMLSGAMEVEIDRQGRINIPAYLRDYAGIKSSVVVAGVGQKLELWAEDRWKAETSAWTDDPEKLAESFSTLGI